MTIGSITNLSQGVGFAAFWKKGISGAAGSYNPNVNATLVNRILTLLAWAGIFVAGVLSIGHAMNVSLPCGITDGCNKVAAHPSSLWFGIPVAYFGLVAYLTLAGLALVRTLRGFAATRWTAWLGLIIGGVGTLTSAYLTIYALTVIRATCPWCLASASIMLLTFLGYVVLGQQDIENLPAGNRQLDLGVLAGCAIFALGGVGAQAAGLQRAKLAGPQALNQSVAVTPESLAPKEAYWLGPKDAPIQVVEYADFYCPGCRESFPKFIEILQKSGGKIRFAYRNFPLFEKEGHEISLKAAVASEFAADHGKYWEFVQGHFASPLENMNSLEGLLKMATALGLNAEELNTKIANADSELLGRVIKDRDNGRRIGLNMTPTYVIFAKGIPTRLADSTNLEAVLNGPEYKAIIEGLPAGGVPPGP